ncbi:MAG: extracellular solute-binding protein [Chloroflexota bacterium]|nr:extracellular solute-binding protein [Chloroflexota bacterium]
MKTKILLLLSILIISSMVLGACATPTEEPTTEPEPTEVIEEPEPTEAIEEPEPTEVVKEPEAEAVTITIWHQWNDEYAENIAAVFADYEAANPGVKIDLSKPEDVANALNVAIPAGEGPDIIGWANDKIGEQALVGNIVALNDFGVDAAMLEEIYTDPGIKGVTWQDMIWGLPETMEGIALVFNADLVGEEYMPTDPMDFADLLAKATKFQEDTGLVLVCNQGLGNPDAYHVAPVYFGHGMPEYVDDQGNAYMNTPEAIAAGDWMVEFSKVSLTETSHELCLSNMVEGKVGSWWTGPWAIADLEKNGINYTILPMGSPFVGIKTVLMTKNAVDRGNEQIALDVMKWFTSPDVQAQLALINKTIPAQMAALENPEVAALPTLAGFGASLSLGVPMANTPYASAQWGPVGDATTAIWTGAQTVQEALDAAQAAIEDAIAQMQ